MVIVAAAHILSADIKDVHTSMHGLASHPPCRVTMSGSRGIATADNVLNAAIATSTLAKELSNSFPPARLAVSILLLIFQTIQVRLRSRALACSGAHTATDNQDQPG